MNIFSLLNNNSNNISQSERSKIGVFSGIVGIFTNILLFVLKLLIGIFSGSVSVIADSMNNLTDASGSVVTFIGFKLAEKPADDKHPYGHARYEYISALIVSAIIIIIGFELGRTSISKIFNPTDINFSYISVVILLVSILLKLFLFLFNLKLGKLISSNTLKATAIDSRNDCVATFVVLASILIEHFFNIHIDSYAGLCVAVFIFYSGVKTAIETISPLIGEAASDELKQNIINTVKSNPKVLGYHDLMVHDYGPGKRFASMHIEMDQKDDPLICHGIIDDLERECLAEHNVQLVIHYDPVVTGDKELDEIKEFINCTILEYDKRLSMHDFRMVRGGTHVNLIFDVSLPYDLNSKQNDIKSFIDQKLNSLNKIKYYTVISFDPDAFN